MMKTFFWILCLLATMMAGFQLFSTMVSAESAPQQGAGAAVACALVIIPYVFARSVEGIIGKEHIRDKANKTEQ